MTDKQKLIEAVELLNGQTATAAAINENLPKDGSVKPVCQANVHSWLERAKRGIPAEYAIPLQIATGGQILASELCPGTFRPDVAVITVQAA